ncbi:amidohydrolase [Weissella cibaria]|uniref:M20 metallopeptidase family protein n=1 Tax=Weissella cibaria TaxID=137591 RepID=UPI000EDFF2E4|nr:amidohydrolase [Weissella cibaria]WCE24116.1 amidohydrolase [Weissella cibaria]WCE26304.1 amidohydrolase [Weissella cibaria]HCU09013.1 amidohydrolase [Weissella cibaria]
METVLTRIPVAEQLKWRRWMHQHAEVSFEEFETTAYIENLLRYVPGLTIAKPSPTGLVATLHGGHPGKTLALRADIDALPMDELADVDFKSLNPGVMHSCGHDVHAAILLGALFALVETRDALHGDVKFIFQAAEEVPPGGAIALVEAGVLDDVDEVFGLHVFPDTATGSVGFAYGPVTASSDLFNLTIKGRGAHAMAPEQSIDPITIGTEIIQSINNMIARRVAPDEPALISWGQFTAGSVNNVIPHTAHIKASVRSRNPQVRTDMERMIRDIIKHVCAMYGAEYDLDFQKGYGSVINSKEQTDQVIDAAREVVGEERMYPMPPLMAGEDFSAYTNVRPGTFFGLGSGLAVDGYEFINHHPKFIVDEACMPVGSAMFVRLVENSLK